MEPGDEFAPPDWQASSNAMAATLGWFLDPMFGMGSSSINFEINGASYNRSRLVMDIGSPIRMLSVIFLKALDFYNRLKRYNQLTYARNCLVKRVYDVSGIVDFLIVSVGSVSWCTNNSVEHSSPSFIQCMNRDSERFV